MTIVLSHSIVCHAEPWHVFSVIAKPEDWPVLFEPCVAVDVIERANGIERIAVTAMVNGHQQTWQSRRLVDATSLQIDVEMTDRLALVAAMRTRWRVYGTGNGQSVLVLEHECDLVSHIRGLVSGVNTSVEAERWITTAIDKNSTVELKNIRQAVERPSGMMPGADGLYRSSHATLCEAPADLVFPFVADPTRWPGLFKPCLAVETLPPDGDWNVVKIHADQGGREVSWTSRRRVNADARIVDYELADSMPYTDAMRGRWRVVPLGPRRSLLAVDRIWSIADPMAPLHEGITSSSDAAAFIARFVDTNARREMDEIAAIAADHTAAPLFIETELDVEVSADEIYAVLANASLWPAIAPHCRSLRVGFDDGVYQELCFEIETSTGEREAFRSFRVCNNAKRSISFVQVEPPGPLERHHGGWTITPTPTGARVTCRHFATPRRTTLTEVSGTTAPTQQDEALRGMIGANSKAIVMACVAHIQAGRKEQAA
ncbi:SRPBCC family protein [Rhizobium ruizarguesonis]